MQLGVGKIVPAVYQYTAIDDCSQNRVFGIYPRRSAVHALDFLEPLIKEMPFPLQRIQTDRGRKFFAETVQQRLMDWAVNFRPIKPRSPGIEERLADWQCFWNWVRPHSALIRKTPLDRICELLTGIPSTETVERDCDAAKEHIRDALPSGFAMVCISFPGSVT